MRTTGSRCLQNTVFRHVTSKPEHFYHRLKTHTTHHDLSKSCAFFLRLTHLSSPKEASSCNRNVVVCVLRRRKKCPCLIVVCCKLLYCHEILRYAKFRRRYSGVVKRIDALKFLKCEMAITLPLLLSVYFL